MEKNIASFRPYVFFCFALIFLPSCIHRKQIDRQKLHIDIPTTENIVLSPSSPPPITIWIHGTLIFYKPAYHNIFNDQSVLIPMKELPVDHHFRMLAQTIANHSSQQFPLEEFYIFGWSGKLQDQERKQAANRLHQEISVLVERYKEKYGCSPTIRIIAHSHGGNVALNMAEIKSDCVPFCIQSLILLACPVQDKTMHLICGPMFQRVYSLYSSFDMIQVLAPQFQRIRTKNGRRKKKYVMFPFSSRLFPTYSHLTQAKIKINDFPISHTRFSTQKFAALLPSILQKLDSWHSESLTCNKIAKHKLLCVYNNKK
jgi:hypothetical protein